MTTEMDPESHIYSFEDVSCPPIKEFSEYWLSLCPEGGLPSVAQFDLLEFPQFAPWIALADVLDDGADFQFRLIGTKIVRVFGGDITGATLSQGDRGHVEGRIALIYKYVYATKGPVWGGGRVGNVDGRAGFESAGALLPLVNDAGEIVRIIHMVRLQTPDGRWMD